jgi:dihydrofolate reductase
MTENTNIMRKLSVFNNVTLDGYFTDQKGDMSWAHKQDAEWNEFSAKNSKANVAFLFGRVTYEMMASFWPTPNARETAPDVADAMNSRQKVVFSRTLKEASWGNTRLVMGDLLTEVRKLKQESEVDLLIFGSGTVVSQLAAEDLIDEYMIVLNPLVLGGGRTMFEGLKTRLALKQTKTQSFGNGNVVVCYEPNR